MTDLLSQPGATVDPRDLRAQEAVRIFRGMQAGMTGFARALTGNKRVTVELATGTPRTDGSKIYLKPPIELGDKYTHQRKICDKRDPVTGTLLCFACKAREEVIVALYHEIGHIAGGTFDPPSQSDQVTAIENSIEAYGSKWAAKLKTKIERAQPWQTGDFLNLSSLVSPFLPIIVNSLEDTRVDNKMFKARKGTKVMFDAWVQRTFADGVEQPDGTMKMWNEYPLNSQAMIGLFIVSCKYNYEGWFAPEVEEALGDEKLNDLLARMDTVKSVRGVYELAFPLLARLKELGFCREPQDDFEEEDEPEPEPDDQPEKDEDSSEDDSESEPDDNGSESDDGESGVESSDDGQGSSDEDGPSEDASDSDSGDGDDSSGMAGETDDEGTVGDAEDHSDGSESDVPDDGAGDSDSDREETGEGDGDGPGSEGGDSADGEQPLDNEPGQPDSDVDVPEADDEADPTAESGGDSPGSAGSPGDSGDDGEVDDSDSDEVPAESGGVPPSPGAAEPTSEGDDGPAEPADEVSSLEDDDEWGTPEPTEPTGAESDEPVDTGADEGMGGVKDDTEPKDWGSADEAGEIVKVFGHHDKVIPTPETYEDELNDKALDAAIIQGLYFEKPSAFIRGVRTHKYGKPIMEDGHNQSVGWPSIQDQDAARRRGVLYDTEVDEAILGPALLETRRTFADNARRGYQNNLKSGRVNRRVLGKRAPIEDPRLFGKKRLPKRKSYAVGIGIDISGSTYGLNIALAKRAARAQAELCYRVGIPFAVWAHTAQYPSSGFTLSKGLTLDIYEVKGFDDPWDVRAIEALSMLGSAHENLDGHGIEYYRRELERIDATDHILMYYTDGKMPAANHDEELEILQREIRYFKQRQMTLMGVGIRTDSPRRHGLDTVQVDTDEDLIKVVRHLEKKLIHTNR